MHNACNLHKQSNNSNFYLNGLCDLIIILVIPNKNFNTIDELRIYAKKRLNFTKLSYPADFTV